MKKGRNDRYIIRDNKNYIPNRNVEVMPIKSRYTYSDPKDTERIERSKNRINRRNK